MKIYEKPSVEIKKFEVEDIILASEVVSSVDAAQSTTLDGIRGVGGSSGVVFEW